MANGNAITDANNIGLLNPIRYRGYYYDAETGFYYLQSRYYDPEIGRFINADGYVSTGQGVIGNNMFVYCNNNPIKYYDFSGTSCRIHEGGRQGPKCPFLNEKCMFHGTSECCAPVKTSSKPKGEKHKTNSLRICTDGATGSYGSNSHQSSTAMSGRLGVNTPADKIPYIVIPLNHPQYDSLIGCMGVVINNSNGNYVYAVVGDGGPSDNGFGEVSLRVAWDLGFSEEEANGACGPEGDFTIVVYPDTRQNWSSDGLYTQIQKVGKKLYP